MPVPVYLEPGLDIYRVATAVFIAPSRMRSSVWRELLGVKSREESVVGV